MQTICKECIFAYFNNNIQAGCSFDDRLTKYQKLGIADKKVGDSYYTINTLCKACTKINPGQILPDNFTEIVKKNISPKVDAIIYGEYEIVKETIRRIKNDGYNKITVCQPTVHTQRLYQELSEIYPQIVVSGQIENQYEFEFVDNACFKNRSDYIVVINNESIPNIPEIITELVMNDLNDFVAILPEKDLHGIVITPKAYKFLGGNFEKSIIDKIKDITNFESMVLQWKNLR